MSKEEARKKRKVSKLAKSMTNFYRRSKNNGNKAKITAILDPLKQKLTYDEARISEIFSLHHQQKTDDPDVDKTAEPELDSPSMHRLATKYNFNLKEEFPAQEDDCDKEVQISLKKMKKLVIDLKGDMTPGKSGVDKYVLGWFIEYFPNVLLQAFNFLLAEPDWENLIHSPYPKRRMIVFLPKKGKDLTRVENYRPISLLEVIYKLISKFLIEKV